MPDKHLTYPERPQIAAETASGPLFSAADLQRFAAGTHDRLYETLGAHPADHKGEPGTRFAVWAPNAGQVAVEIYDHAGRSFPLQPAGGGFWQGFLPHVGPGAIYKYAIHAPSGELVGRKADPFALRAEVSPDTASVVWHLDYAWRDQAWMAERRRPNALGAPQSVYEVHLGSWRRHVDGRLLSYRELVEPLAEHVLRLGFTHVEFLPLMEHPFYGSWGYQSTGYFAPTSRYGTPQDFMYLVDELHRRGIGVILDWVPSHFPTDAHGLAVFDGTHLFEHPDPRRGFHPDWNSAIFDYSRGEVRSFLLSSALFWLDKYHADALRVDAVASMLYLDYSRRPGEWIPNQHGGRENLDAIEFLRQLNAAVYHQFPDTQTIAEESTAWPQVSRPAEAGGLGFGMKWDMGWMFDTLSYLQHPADERKHHHGQLTFRQVYAFNENFMLPLSHDDVVHGKRSLLEKMPGDDWQKFANLRLLLGYMFTQPGKKLLFMGSETAQREEWDHDRPLDWDLLADERHQDMVRWVTHLNHAYRTQAALHEQDFDPAGFEWLEASDNGRSVLSYLRKSRSGDQLLAVVCNFTPTPHRGYRLGLPHGGYWRELLNSDAARYGGSDVGNSGGGEAQQIAAHGRPWSLEITLPPLGLLMFANH